MTQYIQHPTTPDKLASDFAKLDRRLDRKRKHKRKFISSRMLLRYREVERGCYDQYFGPVFPKDDDAALDDLEILASCAMAAGLSAVAIVERKAPWIGDAASFCNMADRSIAYLKADELADRMGWVDFDTHQRLNYRTIGATDVRKAERARLSKVRKASKRKAARLAKPKKLSKREQAVLTMVGVMANMSDIARKAKRHALFRDLQNVPLEVRRVIKRLEKIGLVGTRLEPRRGEKRRREYFVWNLRIAEAKETPAPQRHPESAPPKTPNFTASSGSAKSRTHVSEGDWSYRGADDSELSWLGVRRALRLRCGAPHRTPY